MSYPTRARGMMLRELRIKDFMHKRPWLLCAEVNTEKENSGLNEFGILDLAIPVQRSKPSA